MCIEILEIPRGQRLLSLLSTIFVEVQNRERERKESPLYLLHLILSKMKEQNRLFSCGFLLVIGADALVSCWMMMTRYFFLTLLLSLEMSSGSNPESAKLHYTHRESERCVRVSVRVSMLFIV